MNNKLAAYASECFEPVRGFQCLKAAEFESKFAEDVADLDDELVAKDWRVVPELGEIISLSNGYSVFIDRTSRWTLFESEQHHNERRLRSQWAAFVRGSWTDRAPQEAGLYFVRDRDLGRRSVRELRRVGSRLVDVSGGVVPAGAVSTWRGYWWSEPVPGLPESY